MVNQKQQTIIFGLLLGLVAFLILLVWLPFLKLLALGAILAVLFNPVFKRISKEVKHDSVAAFFTIVLILLLVILPLYLVGQTLFNEIVSLYNQYKTGGLVFNKTAFVQSLPSQIQPWALKLFADISLKISEFTTNAFAGITALLSNLANFVISLVLVFFTTYYLLRDGNSIKTYIYSVLPIPAEQEDAVAKRLENAISGVVKGSFLTALLQGVLATLGFLIFGVPQPFLWGAFTVLAALVPNFGTSLSLIPAILYLFITGHTGAGVGLLIWGALAVGTIDNIVSPKFVGSRTNIHPLLVLFSIIGGINFFGYIGFLLGPILMALFLALLDVYRNILKKDNG